MCIRDRLCPSVLDPGQPGGVDLGLRQVRRQVHTQVSSQVAQLLQATVEVCQRRIVSSHGCQRHPRSGQMSANIATVQAIGPPGPRVETVLVTGEQGVGLAGAGSKAIGMRQSLILGAQLEILPRLRVDGLDLLESRPEDIHLPGPVAGTSAQFSQLGASLVELVIQGGIAPCLLYTSDAADDLT